MLTNIVSGATVYGQVTPNPPSLDLDFVNNETIDPRITFTRASTATYIGSDGLIKTAAANEMRRSRDPVTGRMGALIEEQRTNLIPYSCDFTQWSLQATGTAVAPVVTANYTTAPDGSLTADRVILDKRVGTTSTDRASIYAGSVATVVGQPYAAGVWLKSNTANSYVLRLDLNGTGSTDINYPSVITVTPQWKRFEIRVASATSTTAQLFIRLRGGTGTSDYADISCWNGQQENAVNLSSDIITGAAQVTRAADAASMTGTNFSSWYNQSEGTFVTEWNTADSGTARIVAVRDASFTSNSIFITQNSAGVNSSLQSYSGGGLQINQFVSPVGGGGKVAFGYKENDTASASSAYGSTVTVDSSCLVPAGVNVLTFGDSTNQLNGHIFRLTYYNRRLTNEQLQALSAQ